MSIMTRLRGSCLLITFAVATAAAQTKDARQEVHGYLSRQGFDAAALAMLESGNVVARAELGAKDDREIGVVAAVRIGVARPQVTSYYGQIISYVDGEVLLAFGRFGRPPAPADVGSLALDAGEVRELRSCRPGKCDLRLGGAAIERLRTSIDWSAPDHVDRVNAFVRQSALDYMAAYQSQGDAALVTYNDRADPVRLQDQWRGILANSPLFHEYAPELRAYLEGFPATTLPGSRDIFYWARENFGLAPVVSFVHVSPPSIDL